MGDETNMIRWAIRANRMLDDECPAYDEQEKLLTMVMALAMRVRARFPKDSDDHKGLCDTLNDAIRTYPEMASYQNCAKQLQREAMP